MGRGRINFIQTSTPYQTLLSGVPFMRFDVDGDAKKRWPSVSNGGPQDVSHRSKR